MKSTTVLALILGLTTTAAFASKTKSADVYSATEEGPSEEVLQSAPGYTGETVDVKTPPPSAKVRKAAPPIIQARTAPTPSSNSSPQQYDAVPTTQAEPLIRRLRLVETIIAKYGRAYDYKTLTVTELQTILGQLDNQATQAAEARHRAVTRAELKKQVEQIPPPAESTNSIGSEAPEIPAPFEGGSANGAETIAPIQQNP